MKTKILTFWLLLSVLGVTSLQAQYFGRNKANYESFDFKVYQSPHFEIYQYLNNPERLEEFTKEAEQWYLLHQRILDDTIKGRNPIVLYDDHADFQQTNAIMGAVGVGTGGVTEALKNRVVLPFAMSNQQTNHVLGHELVHAFQYNLIINGDSTSLQSLGNLPLWMVEGLAEYLSIGSVDAHTAMWMRDAVLNDDVPSLKDLQNPKYFPYRYGQAFWAFLTGLKGDEIIEPFFVATAKYGFEMACTKDLGMSSKNLSTLWEQALKRHFGQYLNATEDRLVGKELITKENSGEINIAPQISPNGRYVIFLSEKDLFSIDLFLADARTGKIIRKEASSRKGGDIDDLDYIESAGSWSPDSKQFAFTAFSKGRNILVINDVESGKTLKELPIKGVQAFSNPAWSPDGKTIVVTGLVEGQTDLYAVNIRTGAVEQLTNDANSEMHPHWAVDGSYLVFSTDQLSRERGRTNGKWVFNLAKMDLASRQVENIDIFPGADNLNPVLDTAGNIIFLSNRDGFRNLYQYEPATGKVYQLTDLLTGVSGITPYAPAISIDRRRDKLLYTYFSKNKYNIYRASPQDFLHKEVDPNAVDFAAATLPRVNPQASALVDQQLRETSPTADVADSSLTMVPYKPKFQLDYIGGSAGVGVGTSNTFGTQTGVAGGVDMLFSDMLGSNQVFASLALNGEITDFGGAAAYINRDNRINWGGSLSHIPFRSFAFGGTGFEPIQIGDGTYLSLADTFYVQRIFEDRISAFAYYPFSTILRVEGNATYSRYSSRLDQYVNYYETDGTYIGNLIGQEKEKLDSPRGFNLWNTGAALVGDKASFGVVGPLSGSRFRLGVDQYFGEYNFTAFTADYRKYEFFRPFGLAFRALHYGRYGAGSNDLYPMFIGSSWYVRGYNTGSAGKFLEKNGRDFDELFGSKILVSNFEVRIPFTGPERLALIKSGVFFTELALFADAGVAWHSFDQFNGAIYRLDSEGNPIIDPTTGQPLVDYFKAKPIFSTGVSMRVNLFGAMILEPYYAFPLKTDKGLELGQGTFGLNIIPAW